MEKRILRPLGILLGIVVFFIALWTIHKSLGVQHYRDIVLSLKQIPAFRILLSLSFTVLNYLFLANFDLLASRYAGHPISYRKIALPSFIGYTFNYNAGVFGGSAVRYRLYSLLGFSALEIGKIMLLFFLTFAIGFLTLSGIAFILTPHSLIGFRTYAWVPKAVGVSFLALSGTYIWLSATQKRIGFSHWNITLPTLRMSLLQIFIATIDWVILAASLYVLFPSTARVPFPIFISIFMLAHVLGVVSHSPGGLGVFEATIINLLPAKIPTSEVLGILLAYRGIYYFFPFIIASVLLSIQELKHRREHLRKTARVASVWLEEVAPSFLSVVTFLTGTFLLLSGSVPSEVSRLEILARFIPTTIFEISHFLGSIVGVSLLFLAWGLQQKLDAAYVITALLLLAGIPIALLRGIDYENAITLAVALLILLPCRKAFYRKTSLLTPRLTLEWVATIGVVFACSVWLGFFALKHVEVSSVIWWKFALDADAPRFLRSSLGAVMLLLVLGLYELFRPREHSHIVLSSEEDRNLVRSLAKSSSSALSWVALLGDKYFLFNESASAFLMYGVSGRSWIALGNPVGNPEEREDLIWKFNALVDANSGWTVFTHLPPQSLHQYINIGLTFVKIGEEARVHLPNFASETAIIQRMRDYSFEFIPENKTLSMLSDLKGISDAWLLKERIKEKRFSSGFFNSSYLQEFPLGVIRQNGKVIAFTNLWLSGKKEELSPDLLRYDPGASPDIPELLLAHIILWGKSEGYQWCNLGMIPNENLPRGTSGLRGKAEQFLLHHGGLTSDLELARALKEKFHPLWEPRFLACPGSLSLPTVLLNYASLLAGKGRLELE